MEKTMKKSKYLQLSAGVVAVAIATTTIGIPAFAGFELTQPGKLAQGSLVGQCRAVNKKVSVYKQAATTAPVVSTLNAETKVTLADNGSNGFIGISSPVSGYVQVTNLKQCSGSPTPTPTPTPSPTPTPTPTKPPTTGSTCRRVVQPLGLAIRKEASVDSVVVGGVANLDRVDLTTNPATVKKGADGRNWVQIAKPTAGWVSNGFPDGNSNLVVCP